MTTMTRQQEIRDIWQQFQGLYVLAGILIGLLLFPFLELIINDLSQLLIGLMPEAIGIGFTVFFLDRIYQSREEKRYKRQLIREMGSLDNSTALRALEALTDHGWAQDGTLKNAHLREANLRNARVKRANLWGTHLVGVNLIDVLMYHTNFSHVQMSDSDLRNGHFNVSNFEHAMIAHTDFRNSRLIGCNFKDAWVDSSDFENATLRDSDFRGANMIGANLQGVDFDTTLERKPDVKMDENTILPDGYSWHKEIDLSRYTDPYHPDFWRPDEIEYWDGIGNEDEKTDYHSVPFWWRRQQREKKSKK